MRTSPNPASRFFAQLLARPLLAATLGFARPVHAAGTGSQSTLAVQVTVIRPCVVGQTSLELRPSAERRDSLIREAREALATSCAVEAPRIELIDVRNAALDPSTRTLDVEF